jgi:2-methylcitrate dehydratase
MSTVVERIGRYAAELRFAELDAPVVDYAKRILLDSLACAYGGLDSAPARIVRTTVQEELNGGEQATVLGKGTKSSAPLAALANGVALRDARE